VDQACFGKAGHTHKQAVATCQYGYQHPLNDLILAENQPSDRFFHAGDLFAGLVDRVDYVVVCFTQRGHDPTYILIRTHSHLRNGKGAAAGGDDELSKTPVFRL